MEKRKLVKSGMFSFTIALPKEWVSRHKLDKGSSVYLEEGPDGLLLAPSKNKVSKENKKEHTLLIDNRPTNSIIRDITASYLMNTGTIKLQGEQLKENVELFKEAINKFPGLEVIEETGDQLIVRDFINIDELNIPDLLRRSDNIIRSLFLDSSECIKKNDMNLALAIKRRDQEVNRLTFLVYKSLNHISEHPQHGIDHGVHPSYSTHVWELNGYLEKIGDEVKRLSMRSAKSNLSKPDRKNIESLLKEVEDFYVSIMTSLYKHDIAKADEWALNRYNITDRCKDYLAKSHSLGGRLVIHKLMYLTSFINSISRIIRYISFENHKVVRGSIFSSK